MLIHKNADILRRTYHFIIKYQLQSQNFFCFCNLQKHQNVWIFWLELINETWFDNNVGTLCFILHAVIENNVLITTIYHY